MEAAITSSTTSNPGGYVLPTSELCVTHSANDTSIAGAYGSVPVAWDEWESWMLHKTSKKEAQKKLVL